MIAVIETGGKQYLIQPDQVLKIEKLEGEAGEKLIFDKVLLKADDDGKNVQIGTPYLEGETVEAEVEKQGRSRKIKVLKFKRKTRYTKRRGHRQKFTQIKVK
jgi:large subunit ribosomal protein L21